MHLCSSAASTYSRPNLSLRCGRRAHRAYLLILILDIQMASQKDIQTWTQIFRDAQSNVSSQVRDEFIRVVASASRELNYSDSVVKCLSATELCMFERPEDGKPQARVVLELVVKEDMCSGYNLIHGACLAFLIDHCSSIAVILKGVAIDGSFEAVSQSINIAFYAGTPPGDKLRVINETTSAGSRVITTKTEIWNVSTNRLVASGTHTKMKPTTSRLKL